MTRPFDRHLNDDELDALVWSQARVTNSERFYERTIAEARDHVESCEDCQRNVRMHNSVQSEISKAAECSSIPAGPTCIEDSKWIRVAAGLLPEDETRELMKHSAQCGHCGPLLRNAAETLSDDATPAEEMLVASLRSARPEWQSRMADTLKGTSKPGERTEPSATRWTGLSSWLRPAFGLATLPLLVTAVWVGIRMARPPSADQLLAQAYTDRRTLEVRIPGARYARPAGIERGEDDSNLDKPASLLKAEALIAENLQKNPNDPAWLDARARADLLDGNYDSAIKTLQRALDAQPDSPQLLTDLGSAYFMRAESSDHAVDYGNAVEALGKALTKAPDDPVALFNRALASEKLFLYTETVEDWEHYLRLDPQGEWAEEARKRLAAIQEKIRKHADTASEPVRMPKEFLGAGTRPDSETVSLVGRRAERYLDVAFNSWLPHTLKGGPPEVTSSEDSGRSLQLLAEILKSTRGDPWLADFLRTPASPVRDVAIRELLASDDAVHAGLYGHSKELAQQSLRDFRHAENLAGMLRASLALMVAQSFALEYSNCLQTAADTLPRLSQTQYRWLQAGTLIEQAECFGGAAQLEEAAKANAKGLELARRCHYPDLELRAMAFGASYLFHSGHSDEGLQQLRDGFAAFWQLDVKDTRGQNLYSTLFDLAEGRNWPYTETYSLTELLSRFPSDDPVDRALQREFLAGAQKRAGQYEAARQTLQTAQVQLTALPNDSAVALRRAEIAVDEADVQLDLGDANGAVATLVPFRQQLESSGSGEFQADYFKTLGEAYLALGREADARPLLERTLVVMETGLKSLRQEEEKVAWSRTQSEVYRDLLEVKLKSETPDQAFAWWEWYKDSSFRSAADARSSVSAGFGPSSLALPVIPGEDTTTLISYALLRDSITAFVFHEGVIHLHAMPIPHDLEPLTRRFLTLCSDPSSDLQSLTAEGLLLYSILVAPLEPDIQGATSLRIETDGILDKLPFGLLHGTDGHYLGDKFEVVFSQGGFYRHHARLRSPSQALSRASIALVVVPSGTPDSSLPVLSDATEEGKEVASHFTDANLISGRDVTRAEILSDLRKAQLFHFAGHALAGVSRVGLVLGTKGLLSSRDIVTLQPLNLRLAVLSACDTAKGSEGAPTDVNSLARTLVASGVPDVVASRWSVDSSITRMLMRAFYSTLMSGKKPAESLRAASIAVRNIPGYQHPYYWASFAVFSDS